VIVNVRPNQAQWRRRRRRCCIHPPNSGTTPLHLATSLGRVDIVNLLPEQENVDDSLRDANGKTCRDIARGKDVLLAINSMCFYAQDDDTSCFMTDSRSLLTVTYRSLLHSYIFSPLNDPLPSELLTLLSSPRIKHVDLSYLDEDSGSSLLHKAAHRKDVFCYQLEPARLNSGETDSEKKDFFIRI
jgi:hypothetical protein